MDNFIVETPDEVKIHDYKGFNIEPIVGGVMIVAHCRKHTFYFAGQKGFDLTTDITKAKSFRTAEYCHRLIDEFIRDHADWVKTLSERKVLIK